MFKHFKLCSSAEKQENMKAVRFIVCAAVALMIATISFADATAMADPVANAVMSPYNIFYIL